MKFKYAQMINGKAEEVESLVDYDNWTYDRTDNRLTAQQQLDYNENNRLKEFEKEIDSKYSGFYNTYDNGELVNTKGFYWKDGKYHYEEIQQPETLPLVYKQGKLYIDSEHNIQMPIIPIPIEKEIVKETFLKEITPKEAAKITLDYLTRIVRTGKKIYVNIDNPIEFVIKKPNR